MKVKIKIIILIVLNAVGFNSMSADTVTNHSEGQNSDAFEEAKSLLKKGLECYLNGNTLEFIMLATQAAEMDYTPAQVMLALAYSGKLNTPMIEPDQEMSFKWAIKAADQGDPSAQLLIGGFYLSGFGVPVDKAKGLEYIKKSADQGSEEAIKVYRQLTE